MKSIIDHPLISRFLFYPRSLERTDFPDMDSGSIHTYESGSDNIISAYWYRPLGGAPTLLMFHGNGEVITDYLYDYHRVIESIGLNYAIVDYRGYGLSSGTPSLSGLLEDAHATWSYFTEKLDLDPGDIILMGRSLGSIPALEIASTSARGCRAVIIESGIAALHRWVESMKPILESTGLDFKKLSEELRRNLDHKAKVEKISRPMLIMHTELDHIVPSWNARDLYSWANPKTTVLKIFPQGDHNTIFYMNAEEYFKTIKEFTANQDKY